MKLNLIASACAAIVDKAERDALARDAAYVLPLKQAMRDLHAKLAADFERELRIAIERQLGHPVDDPEILRGRLRIHATHGQGEIYSLDGVEILQAGPVRLERDGEDNMAAGRTLIHLNAGESTP